jgi:hypothetical protein
MSFSTTLISFDPLLPTASLAAVLAPPVLAFGWGAIRRAPGTLWRGTTIFILGLVLANPSLVTEQRQPLRDVAVVVVDRSPSQNLYGRMAQADRALAALRTKLATFPDLDVHYVESPREGDETHLFAEAERAFADVPASRRAGLVFITDGQVHDVPADSPSFGPVHALLTGHRDEMDRRLRLVTVPGFGMVGQNVKATVRVEDDPQGQSREATLLLHGEEGNTSRMTVPVGRDVSLDLPVSHTGLNVTALEVEPVEGELTPANNSAALIVNGVRDRLRVLLVSGFPHNGERTWRNLLKSDPSVDLVHFTILRTEAKLDYTPQSELSLIPFPVDELFGRQLRRFDLVIFDRYQERGLLPPNHLLNIADYVREGGALLDASGPDISSQDGLAHTPLAAVLPSRASSQLLDQPFSPRVTPTGLRHPVTAHLPGLKPDGTARWGRWLRMSVVDPGETPVLMDGADGHPLLLTSREGEGRVAQITSDQIWLWARGFEGGGPQAELLRPLVHWLMKEPDMEENSLSASFTGSQLDITRRSVRPDASPVTVTRPDGTTASVTLRDDGQKATGSLPAESAGIYRLTDGTVSAVAVAGRPNAPEVAEQRTTDEKLSGLLDGTFWLEDMPDGPDVKRSSPFTPAAGRNWMGLRKNGDYSVTGFATQPLLPLAAAALLALAPLLLGWRREGK